MDISPEERLYLKARGIAICSLCRYEKRGQLCDVNRSMRSYSERGQCGEFVPKGKTPEQARIEAMRADEAQGRLFDVMGNAAVGR